MPAAGGGRGARGGALSAEPEVTHRTIDSFDAFVLLASDGLWDVMSSNAAVAIALEELQKRWPRRSVGQRAQAACDRLVREVLQSGHCSDNVTVVLAMLADEC